MLPFGTENPRKRRGGKTPLVETEVRRSDRISKDNAGFRRTSCSNNKCLPCNAMPPVQSKTVVKNITKSFCKVAGGELELNLAKKQKNKQSLMEAGKVSLAMEEENVAHLPK